MNQKELNVLTEEIYAKLFTQIPGIKALSSLPRKMPEQVQRLLEADAARLSLSSEQIASDIARLIDHTALKPNTSEAEIRQLCQEGLRYQFASVCVNPYWVPLCTELLQNSQVKVCTVIGFPLGATSTSSKAFEADYACREGAQEVDMVLNIGALKSQQLDLVAEDIHAVAETAHKHGALLKVILETVLLTDEEKVIATTLSLIAKADFVKTATGFAGGGATLADVRLMRHIVGDRLGVKASGGIRTFQDALQMIKAGATRLGASAGLRIVKEAKNKT